MRLPWGFTEPIALLKWCVTRGWKEGGIREIRAIRGFFLRWQQRRTAPESGEKAVAAGVGFESGSLSGSIDYDYEKKKDAAPREKYGWLASTECRPQRGRLQFRLRTKSTLESYG